MKKIHLLTLVMLVFTVVLSGCNIKEAFGQVSESDSIAVKTKLINGKGEHIGTATLTEHADGVEIAITAVGLAPGKHGIHFHEKGLCEAPDFKSAGAHFNPNTTEHGLMNPKGPHAGDLPNLVVGADGKVETVIVSANVTLKKRQPNSLLKPEGTALVIHEKEDDQVTNPSGNSANRIACGIIQENVELK